MRTVHDAENQDCIVLHEIHDPISPKNDLSKVVTIELGNDTSDVGSFEEHLCGFNDAINESNCMKDGITRDEVFDILKIGTGGQRPADLRHRAILSFSS